MVAAKGGLGSDPSLKEERSVPLNTRSPSAARIEQTVQEITPLHSHKLGLLNTMAPSLFMPYLYDALRLLIPVLTSYNSFVFLPLALASCLLLS